MVLICGNIEKVHNTRILTANIGNNAQLTVYSNHVELSNPSNPVAMILPYPKGRRKIQVIETTSIDSDFFNDIDDCFFFGTQCLGLMSKSVNSGYLPVLRCGNYQYSLVDSTGDFNLVNPNVFHIKPDLNSILQDYENRNFAFIVCIIDKNATYSPFAYITDVVNSEIFIPTKQYHEYQTHGKGVIYNLRNNRKNDQLIYLIDTKKKGNAFVDFENINQYSFSDYLSVTHFSKLHRLKLSSHSQNNDIYVPIDQSV